MKSFLLAVGCLFVFSNFALARPLSSEGDDALFEKRQPEIINNGCLEEGESVCRTEVDCCKTENSCIKGVCENK